MIEGKGLFFKMAFGLHLGLETLQGGATHSTDLFLGDGVSRWRQGGLLIIFLVKKKYNDYDVFLFL